MSSPMYAKISTTVLDAIREEIAHARKKHKGKGVGGNLVSQDRNVAILAKEMGEVAEAAMNYANERARMRANGIGINETVAELRRELEGELIQVAAVAIMWLESL
jgi:NTP pyrophosphatase (non-canonical NTP hydrolase)